MGSNSIYNYSNISVDTYPMLIPTMYHSSKPRTDYNYYADLCTYDNNNDNETVVMFNMSCKKTTSDDATTIITDITGEESAISNKFGINTTTIQQTRWNNSQITRPMQTQTWQHLAQNGTIQDVPDTSLINNVKHWSNVIHYALSDSGATAHFLIKGAPATNIKIANKPITITLPNGKTIKSTHTCNLDIPWLPASVTEAHIVPELSHSSLISTRKFCEAGCKVIFDVNECKVYYKRKLVLSGGQDTKTGLWQLPVNPSSNPTLQTTVSNYDLHIQPNQLTHAAFNVYTLPYKQNQLKFMHQAFFSPTIPTLLHAINNNQLEGVPFLLYASAAKQKILDIS